MKLSRWSQVALSGLIAGSLSLMFAALARSTVPNAAAPTEVAQAAGECRQVRRLERIYSAADVASDRIIDIQPGANVTLAGPVNQPSTGWIRVSYPAQGFIVAAFLVPCGSVRPTPTPTPAQSNACGLVTASSLAVRSGPSTLANATGTVFSGNGFRIVGGPQTQTTPASDRGRIWLRINRYGVQGWIPETGPSGSDSGTNIRRVNCSDIGIR